MLYPEYSMVGKGKPVMRHSAHYYFPPNVQGLACQVVELRTTLLACVSVQTNENINR